VEADSDGEEGRFYTWKRQEIEEALGKDADTLLSIFDLASPANWDGDPILHRLRHPEALAEDAERDLRRFLEQLRMAREQRPRPALDDKVLAAWNGLAVAALAPAARLLDRPDWLDAARSAFRFVCESMVNGRLPHSIRGGKRLFPALATDY